MEENRKAAPGDESRERSTLQQASAKFAGAQRASRRGISIHMSNFRHGPNGNSKENGRRWCGIRENGMKIGKFPNLRKD